MRVSYTSFHGRPGLTAMSFIGSLLMYVGVLAVLVVIFGKRISTVATVLSITSLVLGIALIIITKVIHDRSTPRVVTVDAATYAAIQAHIARTGGKPQSPTLGDRR